MRNVRRIVRDSRDLFCARMMNSNSIQVESMDAAAEAAKKAVRKLDAGADTMQVRNLALSACLFETICRTTMNLLALLTMPARKVHQLLYLFMREIL